MQCNSRMIILMTRNSLINQLSTFVFVATNFSVNASGHDATGGLGNAFEELVGGVLPT